MMKLQSQKCRSFGEIAQPDHKFQRHGVEEMQGVLLDTTKFGLGLTVE